MRTLQLIRKTEHRKSALPAFHLEDACAVVVEPSEAGDVDFREQQAHHSHTLPGTD